jgi:hypothetical protein
LIFTILKEIKNKNPGTLSGKPMEEVLAVTIHFLRLFAGFSFDKEFLKLFGINELIEYSSEAEAEEAIDKEIKNRIESILSHTTRGTALSSVRFRMQQDRTAKGNM